MKNTTIGAPRRGTMIAAVAAVGLALAPAAVTPPGAHALPIEGNGKCRPGQMKVVKGKKYVCDIHGKWIKVLNVTIDGSRIQATATMGVLR